AHALMPPVKLFEQVGIDLEQVERGGIGDACRFHEAEQQEQVVQFGGLLAEIALVAAECGTLEDLCEPLPQNRKVQRPTPTITLARTEVPPRSSSPASLERPAVPRMPGMCVRCTSTARPMSRCTRNSA